MTVPKHILPVIVIAQFCCTSLWFAGNSVMRELSEAYGFSESALGDLTSAVQFGFIIGTLVFALFSIADRFSPSVVFLGSALAGASFNLGSIYNDNTLFSLLFLRFMTGFFLAGIYPVGMKIASDYFDKKLGKSLGLLVGALVIGTALPHLIKGFSGTIAWQFILVLVSGLATLGGLLVYFLVPDGPYRKASPKTNFLASFIVFKKRNFRAAAFGYFGHMWELYAFWAFVPVMLVYYQGLHPAYSFNISLFSFIIIACGGLACALSGLLSEFWGTQKTAQTALFLSGLCCLSSPFFFLQNSSLVFLIFLIFWGFMVVADSPLFSTLVAQNAEAETRGTALTIVNCIGFAITIISIQIIVYLQNIFSQELIYIVLAIGPVLGLIALNMKQDKV